MRDFHTNEILHNREVYLINILNNKEFCNFLDHHHFKKLKDNMFFRIHDNICIDILEFTEIKNYFTLDLSEYILLAKKYGLYCIASKNLRTLENPLYCRYWWSNQISTNIIIESLKQYGEVFWKQYDSPVKLIATMQYFIEHSENCTANLPDRLALYHLYLIKNKFNDMQLLAEQLAVPSYLITENFEEYWNNVMQDMLMWIQKSNNKGSFYEMVYEWSEQ